MRSSLTRAVSAVVLVWAVVSVTVSWRSGTRAMNPVAELEAEFRTLAPVLPSSGAVGFLPYAIDDDRTDRVVVYYVAQYALAPRVVEKRTDVEFLIVARDALRSGGDDRIAGFVPVASSRDGHRVYQRRGQ